MTVRLPGAAEQTTLLDQRSRLARKIEHAQIEIAFIEDVDGLIALYTHQHKMADGHARTATRVDGRKAFTTRARLCEEVVLEAIERRGVVEPIPAGVLAAVDADVRRAANEPRDTVISVDRAIGLLNGALDTLLVLVRVARADGRLRSGGQDVRVRRAVHRPRRCRAEHAPLGLRRERTEDPLVGGQQLGGGEMLGIDGRRGTHAFHQAALRIMCSGTRAAARRRKPSARSTRPDTMV